MQARLLLFPVVALGLLSCVNPPLVAGVDGAVGLYSNGPFLYGHAGVPVSVQVANLGDTDGTPPIRVSVQVSGGVTFASHGPAGWSCTGAAPWLDCEWSDPLPADDHLPDLELALALGTEAEVGKDVRVCVDLLVENDVNPNNNQTCHTYPATAPTDPYDLAVSIDLYNGFGPYNPVQYAIVVENLGPDDAFDPIEVALNVAPGLFIHAFSSAMSCQAFGTILQCQANHLAVGDTLYVAMAATADPAMSGVVTSCATVSAPQDLDLTNDEDCYSFNIDEPAPFDLEVEAEILSVPEPGEFGHYKYAITNNGPNTSAVAFEVIADAPPADSTLVWLAGVSGYGVTACTPAGTGQLSCFVNAVIDPGDTHNVLLAFDVLPSATGTVNACLSIDPLGDTDATNNDACLSSDLPLPTVDHGVVATMTQTSDAVAGHVGSLNLRLLSTGPEAVPGPVVTALTFPPEARFIGATGSDDVTCAEPVAAASGRVVPCVHDADLAPGAHVSLELAVLYEAPSEGTPVCAEALHPGESDVEAESCALVAIDAP